MDPKIEQFDNTMRRVAELRSAITRHSALYYEQDAPEISDFEYDKLMNELKDLEAEYPAFVTSDSPTQCVGGKVKQGLKSIKHNTPMLSLGNVYNEAELRAFDIKLTKELGTSPAYTCEYKIDGLSCSLIYQHGKLVRAVTRGNGVEGEDIMANVKQMACIPQTIAFVQSEVEVRGEIFMRYADFDELNSEREADGQELTANPRNAAAGIVRRKTPKGDEIKRLSFYGYYLLPSRGSQHDDLQHIALYSIPVANGYERYTNIDNVLTYVASADQERHGLAFPTDGVVIKVDDYQYQQQLGVAGKSPRWAIAYKFPPEQAESVIEAVTFQVGRHGAITPVAELRPTLLAGSTISRATLHNMSEIQRKDLMIGDTVIIRKAAEIIPEVLCPVLTKRNDVAGTPGASVSIVAPTHCPSCGGQLTVLEDYTVIRCENDGCPAQVKGAIEHYVSREAMDIDGLGPSIISELVNEDLLRDIPGLYRLTVPMLMLLPRVGKKMSEKIIANIQAHKSPELHKYLYGLGIRHTGQGTAKRLAEAFHTLEAVVNATLTQLADVEDIGDITGASLYTFFHGTYGSGIIAALNSHGVHPQPFGATQVSAKFAGQVFVFTGSLSEERGTLEQKVMLHGGKTSSSVSKKTTYVVAGEGAGSKLTKAKDLGITILDEDGFNQLLSR